MKTANVFRREKSVGCMKPVLCLSNGRSAPNKSCFNLKPFRHFSQNLQKRKVAKLPFIVNKLITNQGVIPFSDILWEQGVIPIPPIPWACIKDYQVCRDAREGLEAYVSFYNNRRYYQALEYKTPYEVHYGVSCGNKEGKGITMGEDELWGVQKGNSSRPTGSFRYPSEHCCSWINASKY